MKNACQCKTDIEVGKGNTAGKQGIFPSTSDDAAETNNLDSNCLKQNSTDRVEIPSK